MQAITIARVSSKDQEDGLSLDAQLRRLNNYIKDSKFKLIHEPFKIVESSTQGERKQFMKILNDSFELAGDEPLAIITDRVDRFQRGFKEQVLLYDRIKEGKLTLHFISENLVVDSNAKTDTWIRYDMSIMGAKMYCLYVSDNTRKALEENLEQGRPIGKLPVGYLNKRVSLGGEKTRSKGIIDKTKAPLIKEAFELYSTRTYSQGKLAKVMREKGLTVKGNKGVIRPISKAHMERVIKDPIYYGMYEIKGKKYPHKFGNIISKELFDQCQNIKKSRSRYAERYGEKKYIFKGLLNCPRCGKMFSTYTQKGLNYAKCNSTKEECDNLNVSEKILLNQLHEVFDHLAIPEALMQEIVEDIKQISQEKDSFERDQIDRIESRLKELDNKLSTLLDMRLEESITQDVYNKKANELKEEQEELQTKRTNYFDASIDYGKVITNLVSITSRALKIFKSSSIDRKRQLLGMIASNYEVDGKILSIALKSPFDIIYDLNKSQEWGG